MKRRALFQSSAVTFISLAIASGSQATPKNTSRAGSRQTRMLAQNVEDSLDGEIQLDEDLDHPSDAKPEAAQPAPPADAPPMADAPPATQDAATPAAPPAEDSISLDEPVNDPLTEPKSEPVVNEAPKKTEPDLAPMDEPAPEPSQPVAQPRARPQLRDDSAPTVHASGSGLFDEPNKKKEANLNRRARGYHPMDDMQWDDLIGERREEIYPVQRGDTLYDISQTFFGDGAFWAKLWSQNGGIENPHRLVKGKGIRFVAGTEGEAPALSVMQNLVASSAQNKFDAPMYREQAETEISQAELDAGATVENDELIPMPNLPPGKKSSPVLRDLPPTFREPWRDTSPDLDASAMDIRHGAAFEIPATAYVNSFIRDVRPNIVGMVSEIEKTEAFASFGQTVFVRMKRIESRGTRVTFLHSRGQMGRGVVYDVLALGELGDLVDELHHIYRVSVVHSIGPIDSGALVTLEQPPRTTYVSKGRHSDVEARVIGGEFDADRRVLGTGAVIYLNLGANSGIEAGDLLGVMARRGSHRITTMYPNITRPIGELKIVDVGNHVSTAIILSATEEIRLGDLTGPQKPGLLPDLKTESAEDFGAATRKSAKTGPDGKPSGEPGDKPDVPPAADEGDDLSL